MTTHRGSGGAFARFAHGVRALRSRQLRLLLLAQFTSQVGYFAFFVCQSWLALELTNSPGLVSLISTAGIAPFVILAIPAGAMADRVNRRKLMIGSRLVTVVAFLVEALLVASGTIQSWQMYAIVFVAGCGIVLDNPPQYKMVADSVPPDEIPSASALVGVVFQLSIITGPLLGGLALDTWGPASGMVIVALGNAALIACYVAIGIPTAKTPASASALRGAVQGIAFVARNRTVGLCILTWAIAILVLNPYQALMSVFARDEIHTTGVGLGLLLAAPGIGALLGSTIAGYDRVFRPTNALMAGALAAAGVALAVTGWASGLQSGFWLLTALGVGWGVVYVLGNSIPMIATPPELRGRVMGVLLWMWGASPIGSAVAGFAAGETNTRVVFAGAGQVTAAFGLLVVLALLAGKLFARNGTPSPARSATHTQHEIGAAQ